MAELTYEECLEENKKLRKRLDTGSYKDDVARIDREEKIIALLHEEREALADLKSVHDSQFRAESERAEATLKNGIAELDNKRKQNKLTDEAYYRQVKDLQIINDREQAVIALTKANRDQFNNILSAITGIDDKWKKTTWGMLLEREGWDAMARGIKETFTPMNILGSSLMKVQEMTMLLAYAQDEAIAEMHKLTGAAPGLEKQMIALEHEFSGTGVSADEAGKAISTLFNTVTDFNRMGPATQKELADTTAVLNEMGVSMDTTAGNIQTLTKVFGVSGMEAAETSRELFTLAQNLGMAPEEVAANFAAAGPKMAAFGEQGVETFKKLQAAAKQSGMQVDQMLGIVEKFDTFEGAAESVGKLNAILGGPFLSSLDMVTTTDPTERMKMLSEAVNESGQSFDEMSYYQRKALADAMGLADVAELALVMRDGFDAAVPAQQQSQEALAAQAKAAAEYQTIKEELTQTFRQFAVSMRPVIQAFKWTLQLIQDINGYFGGYFIPGIILLTGAFVTLKKVTFLAGMAGDAYRATVTSLTAAKNFLTSGIFKNTAAFFSNTAAKIKDAFVTGLQTTATEAEIVATNASTASQELNTVAQRQGTAATGASGKAAGKAAPMLLAFGAAVLFIGAGVYLAATGVGNLVASFKDLNDAQLAAATGALLGFAIAVGVIMAVLIGLVAGPQAAPTAAAVGVMLAVAAAAFLIGAGVGLAAAGLGLLVASFGYLFEVANPATLILWAAGFAAWVAVLWLMVPLASVAWAFAIVLTAISAAIIGIGAAFSLMDFDNFKPISEFFTSLVTLTNQTSGEIEKVAKGISKIVAEVNKLDAMKAITLSTTMDSVTAVTRATAGEGVEGAPAGLGASKAGQPVTIILKLKEKVLAKEVGRIVNGMFASDTDASFA